MPEEEKKSGIIKWVVAITIFVLIIVFGVLGIMFFAKDSSVAKRIGGALPFGELSPETPRAGFGGEGSGGENTGGGIFTGAVGQPEPLFRQLTTEQIAGATAIIRGEKTYVRYMLRENGHIHEIDTTTWADTELTNTSIPRVYEAYFGNNGNTVVLRYLKLDQLTRQDVIKTFLADLVLPEQGLGATPGKLVGKDLLDNISSVSISPNGALLFFLLPIADGVSGSIVDLASGGDPREVLRNSFSEWIPQILNNGTIILTTKASAKIPGYSYLYQPTTKALTRLVREKNGLTALGDSDGSRILFNENIGTNVTLGLYNQKGYSSEEGYTIHEAGIPLTALPEKCAWGVHNRALFFCGSFQSGTRNQIPDDWYQGFLHLKDTFWAINADTAEIRLLADPQTEIKKDFDVFMPFLGNNDNLFFFTDKNSGFLWVMRIVRPESLVGEESIVPPPPTPEEASDASGSTTN